MATLCNSRRGCKNLEHKRMRRRTTAADRRKMVRPRVLKVRLFEEAITTTTTME